MELLDRLPLGAWLLILAAHGWFVYRGKPISESGVKREIERQRGSRDLGT